MGYKIIASIQIFLSIVIFISLPLWKKGNESSIPLKDEHKSSMKIRELLKIKGVTCTLLSFFCYSAYEASIGLWGSSFLVSGKGFLQKEAAQCNSLFYLGITLGRGISGFISIKINHKNLIRIGQGFLVCGMVCMLLLNNMGQMISFFLLGLGCAPIYPNMLHLTPRRFGKNLS